MNEDRIKKMARLAMYEQTPETGKDLDIVKYHRRDYVAFGIVGNVFLITIAFILCIGIYAVRHISDYMENIGSFSIKSSLLTVLLIYGIILALYSILVFVIRRVRYERARERASEYYNGLCEIAYSYDLEDGKTQRRKPGKDKRKTSGRTNR